MEGDDVDRRRLLGMTGVIVAAAASPQTVWEDLVRVRHGRVDAAWAEAAESHTATLVSAYKKVKPAELLPHVQTHLDLLGGRLGEAMTDRTRRRLGRATAESGALGAELAMHLQRWGQADGFLALAEAAAREADDGLLAMQVGGLAGVRHSRVPRGEIGPSGEAIARLEKQAAAARYGAPPVTAAWLHGKLAVEQAAGGRGAAAARTMTVAERLMDRGTDEREADGLFSLAALFDYWKSREALRGFEGVALLVLGDGGAQEPLEEGLRLAEGNPVAEGGLHADLLAVYAQKGEVEKAVRHGHRALDLAEETGFHLRRERVRARAKTLGLWRELGMVREFEERVRMVA